LPTYFTENHQTEYIGTKMKRRWRGVAAAAHSAHGNMAPHDVLSMYTQKTSYLIAFRKELLKIIVIA
jgi:hypothetical protein